ncbi:MAG TPA: sulfate ABC transporter permease subunit CysT [Gemmatimonadales bacterium]|nr:sulfate ABC transporter permease subunit CysT [Gemmatimonadales bacterium]
MTPRRSRRPGLPGFGVSLGFAMVYLSMIVLIPLSTIFLKSAALGWRGLWGVVTTPRVLASCRLSLVASLAAAGLSGALGLVVAWVLARYRFPGRRVVDAFVDLPFALPTAVAGISLTTLYGPHGWIGARLASLGIQVAFTRLGIMIALTFIGLPFVIRTLQPVLEDFDVEVEDAAASLGATRWETFRRVLFPTIRPALITGIALAFARAVGEYGSVVFIAGNLPMRTEIAPLLIMTKLEEFDYAGAAAIAVVLLLASFAVLVVLNLQMRVRDRDAETA